MRKTTPVNPETPKCIFCEQRVPAPCVGNEYKHCLNMRAKERETFRREYRQRYMIEMWRGFPDEDHE